jgi:phosphoribosyl 1,2-cyclic phosphate phosphodiesterase
MKITFLGTGTSHGVPSVDCMLAGYKKCSKDVCRLSGSDPKHNRTRSSILVEYNEKHVLIDVSSDFRQQALREKIPKIDAVIITHGHADHICGIPDIRSYTANDPEPLPFYGSEESMTGIRNFFPYIFAPDTFLGGGIPKISTTAIHEAFPLFGRNVIPLLVEHGDLIGCYGYRIGAIAYIPDMKSPRFLLQEKLAGLEVLILNCLRETREHSSHLIMEQSINLAREIRPKQCFFIHMSHDIHYQADKGKLDPWMDFSYDGLQIVV